MLVQRSHHAPSSAPPTSHSAPIPAQSGGDRGCEGPDGPNQGVIVVVNKLLEGAQAASGVTLVGRSAPRATS